MQLTFCVIESYSLLNSFSQYISKKRIGPLSLLTIAIRLPLAHLRMPSGIFCTKIVRLRLYLARHRQRDKEW